MVVKFRGMSWSKGYTKETHPSVMKISRTMKARGIDNFKNWRIKMKKIGKIPSSYPPFRPSENLAEYIGVVLGDGNISKFPRSERIIIAANSNNHGFIKRYADFTQIIFNKKPTVSKVKSKNCVRISLYQKEISRRLRIPTGNRGPKKIKIPKWIWENDLYVISLLRGLFEAEGSLSIHLPTCTYNFQFCNKNASLLKITEKGLRMLGYHPEIRKAGVRLRRKAEVESFKKLIRFREY